MCREHVRVLVFEGSDAGRCLRFGGPVRDGANAVATLAPVAAIAAGRAVDDHLATLHEVADVDLFAAFALSLRRRLHLGR